MHFRSCVTKLVYSKLFQPSAFCCRGSWDSGVTVGSCLFASGTALAATLMGVISQQIDQGSLSIPVRNLSSGSKGQDGPGEIKPVVVYSGMDPSLLVAGVPSG